MENASKALIMAGGVLIATLLISLTIYMVTILRGVANSSEEQFQFSQIESFNRFFVNYGSQVTGLDVYNILGKIEDITNDKDALYSAPIVDDNSFIKNRSEVSSVNSWDTSDGNNLYKYEYGFSGGLVSWVRFTPSNGENN